MYKGLVYSSLCYDAFDYWGKGTTVTVTSAAQIAPTVFPLTPCGSGGSDMVTLGCLATGFNPSSITFSWQQGSTSLNNVIQYPSIQKGNEYMGISQVQVSRQDWDARKSFKCIATHAAGERHTIVTPPLPLPKVYELPTLKVCSSVDEGKEEAYFSCFAKDFSPNEYEITWLKDDQVITGTVDEVVTSSQGRNDTNGTILYSVASLLTLPSREVPEGAKLTCLFKGKGKDDKTPVYTNSTVSHKRCSAVTEGCSEDMDIRIIPPTNKDIFLDGKGTLICEVTEKKAGFEKVVWLDEDDTEVVSTQENKGSNVHLAKIEITFDEWSKGLTRVCEVHSTEWIDPVKKEYRRNNGRASKRPSVFMLPPLEQTRENTVVLTCYVKDFSPREIYVDWLVDDEKAGTKYQFSTTEPVENNGLFSVYSQLILTQEQWNEKDVVYSCAVHHESVAKSSKSIVRSIGSRTFEKTNVVNLNMNVPETCKAQ
uniref:Ig-like domain-containing protein n=1 Tax=Poecilia reticulata TaxID=8081 RepID=A0A3P9MW47_POERE